MNPVTVQELNRYAKLEREQLVRRIQITNQVHAARGKRSRGAMLPAILIAVLGALLSIFLIAAFTPQPITSQPVNSVEGAGASFSPDAASCTIITAVDGETVLFANNEDRSNPDVVIGFYPASTGGFGSVHMGFRNKEGNINYEGAMNDHGLAWDLNGLSPAALTPHPEKPYSHAVNNYLTQITKHAASVEDAIAIANAFDFAPSLGYQIHIADASGDAVVISAGPDGELAFTRKEAGDGYLISTNFNLADPSNRQPLTSASDPRYTTATEMMEQIMAGNAALTPDTMESILDATQLGFPTYTVYSHVFDLQSHMLYLVYLTRYDEMLTLDIDYELSLGEHVYEASALFSRQAVEEGMQAYKKAQTWGAARNLAVLVVSLAIIVAAIVMVVRWIRRRRSGRNAVADTTGSVAVENA